MSIAMKCPKCYQMRKVKTVKCKCGKNLATLKRKGTVEYWMLWREKVGEKEKQHKLMVGYSVSLR